jgi:hypothetical protein
MDVKAFLDRVETVFGVKGATKLARALEIPQGRVEGWYARLSPDIIFILDKLSDRQDIDIGWLITGKVSQMQHDLRVARLEGRIEQLERANRESMESIIGKTVDSACKKLVSELRISPQVREVSPLHAADAAVHTPPK